MGSSILDNVKHGLTVGVGLMVASTAFMLHSTGWDFGAIAFALFMWSLITIGATALWATIALSEDK